MSGSSEKRVLQAEPADWSVTALAINADATNRVGELKEDLVRGLMELINFTQKETKDKLSIVTVSELNSTKRAVQLAKELGWNYATEKIGTSDALFTAYNPEVWELYDETKSSSETSVGAVTSNIGRYLAMKLRMKSNNRKLLYISVHLPHKENKERAYVALNNAIEDLGKDVDGIMIGGDWNMEPAAIEKKFKVQLLAFKSGGTSKSGKTIDNFALMKLPRENKRNWTVEVGFHRIMTEKQKKYTTDTPIVADAKFTAPSSEPTAKSSSQSEKKKVLFQGVSSEAKEGQKAKLSHSQEKDEKIPEAETEKQKEYTTHAPIFAQFLFKPRRETDDNDARES